MASSRNSSSSNLPEKVAAQLRRVLAPGAHLLLGLSGGVDSVVLLAVLAALAAPMQFSLRALHVNHGISPNARRWADFCADLCRRFGVPLQTVAVDLTPLLSLGPEAAARRARYEVLAREDADFVVLAHHRDDQAETLLLQLLRGAGPAGLAAMPAERSLFGSRARALRPLLAVSRADIEGFARERGLDWIEDESNADTRRQRNFLRHRVLPLVLEQYPAAHETIARAAAHLGEAVAMLDDLARLDTAALEREGALDAIALRGLGAARAKNVLRFACAARGAPPPPAARLEEFWRQLASARAEAALCVDLPQWQLRRHAGLVYLEPRRAPLPRQFCAPWNGESALPLLALGGVLRFKPEEGRGLSVGRLGQAPVSVRLRRGGERLRPDCRRPRRTLKNLLQERRIPPWRRARLPLVYCGEELVCAPGIAEDCGWQAAPGEAGLIVTWEPMGPA
ncbi:MAG: tRNA lysidine(34) synthetase TilS [Betaproteobacteria bacterium]|nr:tRNA lysidine(34) synthetase TilS [Betaproteobacteria bacterium]MBI2959615.1 tRNA lysidine(34) synthetase TilS [Betaproteobacteria bacterium]